MTRIEKAIKELSQLYDFYQKIKKHRRGFENASIERPAAQPTNDQDADVPSNQKLNEKENGPGY